MPSQRTSIKNVIVSYYFRPGLGEEIEEKKDEIRTHFKVYHGNCLKETESMLLGDLDAMCWICMYFKEKEKDN